MVFMPYSAHKQLQKGFEDRWQKLDIAYNKRETAKFDAMRSAFHRMREQMRR